jgi:hypothetical protein
MQAEHYVSTTKLVAYTMWSVVAGLMLATWVLAFAGDRYTTVAILLAFTAGALAPAAAVAHIKIFAVTTRSLIRVTAGLQLDEPESRSLHSVP